MGLLETIGKAVGGFILTFSLVALVFAYGYAEITNYDSLKPVFTEITTDQLNKLDMNQLKAYIDQGCRLRDNFSISLGEIEIMLDCKEIANANLTITKYISEAVFKAFYYKDYDCAVIECLKNAMTAKNVQNMTVLLSAEMNAFLRQLALYLLAGIVIGIVIIILSLRKLFPILKAIGASMIIAGAGFIILLAAKYIIPMENSLSGAVSGIIEHIMNTFIYLYAIVFIAGIVLYIIGWLGPRYSKTDKNKEMHKTHKKHK